MPVIEDYPSKRMGSSSMNYPRYREARVTKPCPLRQRRPCLWKAATSRTEHHHRTSRRSPPSEFGQLKLLSKGWYAEIGIAIFQMENIHEHIQIDVTNPFFIPFFLGKSTCTTTDMEAAAWRTQAALAVSLAVAHLHACGCPP